MAAGVPSTDEQREPWVGVLAGELRCCAQRDRSCALAYS
jgi:gluconate kinase